MVFVILVEFEWLVVQTSEVDDAGERRIIQRISTDGAHSIRVKAHPVQELSMMNCWYSNIISFKHQVDES